MARRINRRFVTILGGSALAVICGLFLAEKLLIRVRPEQFISAARDAAANGRWDDAVRDWQLAVAVDPQNPQLLTSLGEAYANQANTDADAAARRLNVQEWQSALEIDPKFLPALKDLMNYWYAHAAESPLEGYRSAREGAQQIIRLYPNDPQITDVRAILAKTSIEGWRLGLPTDEALITDAVASLQALAEKDPTNADYPYYLSLVDLRRGQTTTGATTGTDQPAEATAFFQKASDRMQAATKAQDLPEMHYHAAIIDEQLSDLDHSSPDNRNRYRNAAAVEMDRAVSLMKGKEPYFIDICMHDAQLALNAGDNSKAHDIATAVMKQGGSDAAAICRAEPIITPFTNLRSQAILTLKQALEQESQVNAISARRFILLGALTDLQIGDLLDAITNKADSKATAGLRASISANLTLMQASNRNPDRTVQLQARFAAIQNQNIDVIQVITAGMESNPRIAADPDLRWMLAKAYYRAHERQPAMDNLRIVINSQPDFLEARRLLVVLLADDVNDNARREMSQQIRYLRSVAPDLAWVRRLAILQMDPVRDADQIKTLYAELPETDIDEIMAKVSVAIRDLRDYSEATRLLTKAVALSPDDVGMVVNLAQSYVLAGHTDQAVDVLQHSLNNQKDPRIVSQLQLALAELQKKSPEEISKLKQEIANAQDPVDRDLQLAQDAQIGNNTVGAETFLKAAETQDPANHVVWNRLFIFYLSQKQFDKAAQYQTKLSATNDDQAHGLLFQFQVDQAKDDVDAEVALGKQLTTDYPEFAKSYQCLGQAYQAAKRWRDAISAYDMAMQKKGLETETAVLLKSEIQCFYSLNEVSRAQMAIVEGRRKFPNDIEFRMFQIDYELNTGDSDAACTDLEDLLKARPDLPEIYLVLARAKMAIAEEKAKIPDIPAASAAATRARDVLQQGLVQFPDNTQFYGALADVLIYGNDNAGAEKLLQGLDHLPNWKTRPDPQILLSQFYDKVKQPDKSEAALSEALRRSKNSAQVEMLYSKMLVSNKHYDKALALLQSINPDNASIRRNRVMVLMMAGKNTEAEAELKSLLDSNPSDASKLHSAWAQLALQEGNLDVAAQHISLALAADPQNSEALALRGKLKMKQTPPDAQGAITDLQAARLLNPKDNDILGSLADVYLYRFDALEAGRILQAAVRQSPDDIPLRLRLVYVLSSLEPRRLDQALATLQEGEARPSGAGNPILVNAEASVYQSMGNVQQALQTIHDGLVHNPGNPPLIHTYLDILVGDRQFSTVDSAATAVLQSDSKAWWAWSDRAQARSALGNKPAAIDDFQQALKLVDESKDAPDAMAIVQTVEKSISPDKAIEFARQRQSSDSRWDLSLVLLLHDAGQDDQAVASLDQLLANVKSLPPSDQINLLLLAGMVYGTASPTPFVDKSYNAYAQVLVINPTNVQALNNIASLCADSFNPPRIQEGLDHIRKAMDLLNSRSASDPISEDTYGWLLILSGQTTQGMDVLTKAAQKQKFPEVFYHLGEGYLRMNQPDKAQQEVNLALSAVSDARQANQPVSDSTRKKIDDLSNRVLDSLRVKTTGSIP